MIEIKNEKVLDWVRECAELTKREIAVMDDFSAALLSLNDSVCDLQAVLELEQSKDRESEERK